MWGFPYELSMGGLRGEGGERIFGWGIGEGRGRRCRPPSTNLQASRGEEGRLKNLTGGVRAEMEERWSGQEFFGGSKKSESFHTERLISITCVLWIGGDNHVPVFSRVEREKRIWMKVFSSLARKGKCLQ